ncbi:MAG: magnesium/cobalt transporter CorA [Chloroflexi bacterium]|nr:magnesium/cobalt transporter CorA [Chloroflexota bacterium]
MPLTAFYLAPDSTLQKNLTEAEVKAAFESKRGLLWVDITSTDQRDARFLESVFKFHRLAIEDCVDPLVHPPKIDDFEEYLFIIVHGINHQAESEVVETTELEIFLGPHFVVSNHNFAMMSVDGVRRRADEDGRPMRYGAQFLTHALIDAVMDNVMPTIDRMAEVAEKIEEAIVDNPDRATLDTIIALRRSTLRIHRVMAPQREVLNRMSRGEFPIVSAETEFYYRNVYDHIVRIEDLNQTLRERADTALSSYYLAVAYRQNEIVKVLSLIAAVFLPLNLIAGIYGMNLVLPGEHFTWAFYLLLGIMILVGVGTVAWFVYRGWFNFQWFLWEREPPSLLRLFKVEPKHLKRMGETRLHTPNGPDRPPAAQPREQNPKPPLDG